MTKQEAQKAWKWFAKAMGMEDWKVRILVQNSAPSWAEGFSDATLGMCNPHRTYKTADVWICPEAHERGRDNMLDTLFHEYQHIIASDIRIDDADNKAMEFVWNQLGKLFSLAYKKKLVLD